MMKNAFNLTLKALFVLTFSPDILCHVGEWFDKKAKDNSKIYDITNWETNGYNTHIAQHLKK